MRSTIVELKVSPPFERPHLQGVIARVSIPHDPMSQEAEVRARPYQAMDWMEFEPETELNNVKPCSVTSNRAHALLGRVLEIRLPLVSPSEFGIHETSYRLRVYSGASFCEFNWSQKTPAEWQALEQVVQEIESLASEALRAA